MTNPKGSDSNSISSRLESLRLWMRTDPVGFRAHYVDLTREIRDLLVVEHLIRREISDRWELKPNAQDNRKGQCALTLSGTSAFCEILDYMCSSDALLLYFWERYGERFA